MMQSSSLVRDEECPVDRCAIDMPSRAVAIQRTAVSALPSPVLVNGRFRVHKMTGIGRYANEIISRLPGKVEVIEPDDPLKGLRGHAWEQFVLPLRARRHLLWSPCSTGPTGTSNQVVTVHDMFPIDNPEWFSRSFAVAFRTIVIPLIRRAKRVITVSEFTRQRVLAISGIKESQVVAIHSGVGSQFATPSRAAAAAAREAAGIPAGRYFLSVSSLEPRKNLKRILEAWTRALPHLPDDYSLVLAGGTGSKTVFQSLDLASAPARVIMPGYVADEHLPGLYAGARALLYPSLAEGFGLPVLEAMASGTPVLTSGNSSLVEIAANAACLVDPMDVDAIARGIKELADDDLLCSSFKARGLTQAARFTWNDAAARTWQVLERELSALKGAR